MWKVAWQSDPRESFKYITIETCGDGTTMFITINQHGLPDHKTSLQLQDQDAKKLIDGMATVLEMLRAERQ